MSGRFEYLKQHVTEYKRLGRPHTYGKDESHLLVSLDTGAVTDIVLTEAEL